jgi:chloride channel protein, CIC family
LISLVTNLAYFGVVSTGSRNVADNTLGWTSVLIPVIGCFIIGLMARYGSEKIRGHGIPEAIEAILIGRSRIQARVAVLKPLSSAISIGTGGPFGAEGPIIMTGGAIGSLFAQLFHLTNAERKTLLVAGAAAGMSATFGTLPPSCWPSNCCCLNGSHAASCPSPWRPLLPPSGAPGRWSAWPP